jgi:hypothetical protein
MTAIAHRGAIAYYDVLDTIKDILISDVNVNTVTRGDITRVNLNKQDIFPVSHIILNNVTEGGQTLIFNISVLAMDVVDVSKSEATDIFVGNDNEQDIKNTQLNVVNKLVQKLRRSDIRRDGYQVNGTTSIEPFYDRFENEVAGWALTMSVEVMNNIDICV